MVADIIGYSSILLYLPAVNMWPVSYTHLKVIIKYGGGVRGGKAIMRLIGIDCGDCRLPITPLDVYKRQVLDYILNLLVIRKETQTTENLGELRNQIDDCDNEIIDAQTKYFTGKVNDSN